MGDSHKLGSLLGYLMDVLTAAADQLRKSSHLLVLAFSDDCALDCWFGSEEVLLTAFELAGNPDEDYYWIELLKERLAKRQDSNN